MSNKYFKLEAPWDTFAKKLKALFEKDTAIKVGDISSIDDESGVNYNIDIEVYKHDKYLALCKVMPRRVTFGNVTMSITLYDEENGAGHDEKPYEIFKKIFEGNDLVKDVLVVPDFTGTEHCYIRFKPEVIQFFDDDISDYNGNWSGLAQNIANEVFENRCLGIHFCTAALNDPENEKE